MTLQERYLEGLENAKNTAIEWALDFITLEGLGDDITVKEPKLILLVKWIEILQDWYNKKYLVAPGYKYINDEQAFRLLARMNALDFSSQQKLVVNPSGSFDRSYDNSYNHG